MRKRTKALSAPALQWAWRDQLTLRLFAWHAGTGTGWHMDAADACNIVFAFTSRTKVRPLVLANLAELTPAAITVLADTILWLLYLARCSSRPSASSTAL